MMIAAPRRELIPFYTPGASYRVTIPWDYVEETIKGWESDYGLDLDPDFQRPFCWTVGQDGRYVEHVLRGGAIGRELLFNCAGWQGHTEKGPIVLVDGKQRLRAVRHFLADKVEIFGGWKFSEFGERLCRHASVFFTFHVNDLATRSDVLRWYLEVNAGGTPHTAEEIQRVRKLLAKEENRDA